MTSSDTNNASPRGSWIKILLTLLAGLAAAALLALVMSHR